jgi:hypothetical protein
MKSSFLEEPTTTTVMKNGLSINWGVATNLTCRNSFHMIYFVVELKFSIIPFLLFWLRSELVFPLFFFLCLTLSFISLQHGTSNINSSTEMLKGLSKNVSLTGVLSKITNRGDCHLHGSLVAVLWIYQSPPKLSRESLYLLVTSVPSVH